MTQEEKELLLKDLSARLPYKVKCQIAFDEEDIHIETLESVRPMMLFNQVTTSGSVVSIENVKPYFRPMSSMTREEKIKIACMADFNKCTKSIEIIECSIPIIDFLLFKTS